MDAKSGTKFVLVVNKNMFIWDTVKEEIVDSFTLYSDIYSVAINKSFTRLACGCKDRLIRIFNTQSGLLWFIQDFWIVVRSYALEEPIVR
jgi:WD40 repeat protein